MIIFNGNETKNYPKAFPGVILKSFLHPQKEYNDGYNADQIKAPEINYSFGLFTIEPNKIWPATKFNISEVSYILEGEGIFIDVEGVEHSVKPGFVVYMPKNEIRIRTRDLI